MTPEFIPEAAPEGAAPPVTPIAAALADRIRREGPIGIEGYLEACLHDPVHGYYRKRRAIGREGDFITAPEISQVFGELIGLWCAVVWQSMGEPGTLRLIELGPGRGTLMRDVLRAARALKGFGAALRIELVEINAALIAEQKATLKGEGVAIDWHAGLDAIAGAAPAIVLANEFLDALPLAQWVWRAQAWRPRCVGLDSRGRLAFTDGLPVDVSPLPPVMATPPAEGAIFETRARAFAALAQQLAALGKPSAGLFIDYGHAEAALGDTLQGARAHRYEHPLAAPGDADLTAQVDFAGFAAAVGQHGLACDGPVTQAEFLGRLGIAQRASRLMGANPEKAGTIETAVARLMAPGGMGTRFKVLGIRDPSMTALPGLARVDRHGEPA